MLPWPKANPSVQQPNQPIGNQGPKVRPTKPLGSVWRHPVDSRVIFLIRAWSMEGLVGVVCDLECSCTLYMGIDAPYILVLWGLMDGH